MDRLRLFEHVHGHLGWLTVAVLVHPAILLRRPQRRAHLAVGAGALFVTLTFVLGTVLYGPYRAKVKQLLFIEHPTIGFLFERKEHLAFGALVLAWVGAATYIRAARNRDAAMGRIAHHAFIAAAFFAFVAATLATLVASYRTF